MKKLTAILLAMLMVSFCFATTAMADESVDTSVDTSVDSVDATSDDATSDDATSEDAEPEIKATNVAAGKTYTIVADDGDAIYNGAYDDNMGEGFFLTDGIVRDVEELTSSGNGNMNKTIELAGTNRTHFVTIDLGAAQSIDTVVLGTIRRGHNRYANLVSVEVLVNGAWVAVNFNQEATVIEGAGQYGDETQGIEPYDQFFNVTATFNAVTTTSVKIGLNTDRGDGTRGYIAQIDEIEVYAAIGSTDTDNSTSAPSVPSTPSTPSAGDLGLGVFAVLAVVSLAGVVVAKKVK